MIIEETFPEGVLTHNLTTFQWKDVEESQRPASPLDEYARHQHAIPAKILNWKWESCGFEVFSQADLNRLFWLRRSVQRRLVAGTPIPWKGRGVDVLKMAAERCELLESRLNAIEQRMRRASRRQSDLLGDKHYLLLEELTSANELWLAETARNAKRLRGRALRPKSRGARKKAARRLTSGPRNDSRGRMTKTIGDPLKCPADL